MDGFQYTAGTLDFFPHAEGYVKVMPPSGLGGAESYHYVFNYTDHLGNIRLRYTLDPQTSEVTILEEDHYYPYGLKHNGYNSSHTTFNEDEETNSIILTPVNPFLGDTYNYKFGGKEYQDEFDINTYDFGARNYDPALGRWMNLDPLAEYAYTHSPYHYAYNNPIYYIDPDGMMALPMAVTTLGEGINGVKDIGGGGHGLSGNTGGQQPDPKPDPQYPNTSGVQQLEEVNLGTVKKKNKGCDNCPTGWGYGTEDLGNKRGTRNGDFDMQEMPTGTGGSTKTPNWLMNLLRELLDLLSFADDGKDAIEKYMPNESTMENKNDEPVEPPKVDPPKPPAEINMRAFEYTVNSNPFKVDTVSKPVKFVGTRAQKQADSLIERNKDLRKNAQYWIDNPN
jgi:RHS repeat-associated protein